jgi:hypothetical protein
LFALRFGFPGRRLRRDCLVPPGFFLIRRGACRFFLFLLLPGFMRLSRL